MAIDIQIPKHQLQDLERTLKGFPNGVRKVTTRSVNATAKSAHTNIRRAVSKHINMKQKDVAERYMRLFRATFSNPSARIVIFGERVPLYRFGARQTKRGVSAKIARSGGRKQYAGAFVAQMESGHIGVFRRGRHGTRRVRKKSLATGRKYQSELPINELHGPSVPEVVDRHVIKKAAAQAMQDLDKHLSRQIDRLLATGR